MADVEKRRKVIRVLTCAANHADEGMISFSVDEVREIVELLREQNPPIRCAECRYYEKRCPSEDIGWCNRPGAGCGQPEEFWCAGAERKEDGGGE